MTDVWAHRDEDGTGKGDGLVTYLKQPSVDLAIQILDGTPLRDGDKLTMTITQVPYSTDLLASFCARL